MTESNQEIFKFIENEINNNDVVVFMKGTKKFPMCGFSGAVVAVFGRLGVDFADHNILENPELRQGIKDFANWPTIPQIFIKGEFIGGCDIIREMYETGELAALLSEKGIAVNEQAA